MAIRDATVGGYTVPKGAWVIPFVYSSHHDYEYWGDPDNFRPERWIDDEGALMKHQAFMPFSVGMCGTICLVHCAFSRINLQYMNILTYWARDKMVDIS